MAETKEIMKQKFCRKFKPHLFGMSLMFHDRCKYYKMHYHVEFDLIRFFGLYHTSEIKDTAIAYCFSFFFFSLQSVRLWKVIIWLREFKLYARKRQALLFYHQESTPECLTILNVISSGSVSYYASEMNVTHIRYLPILPLLISSLC